MPKFDRSNPWNFLPIALAVVVLLVGGYVQGHLSERWGTFPILQQFSDQLAQLEKQLAEESIVSNWNCEVLPHTDEKLLKVAGAEGEVVLRFTNKRDDTQVVQVSIICARLQEIFHHTPDRCYPAAGFEMQSLPERKTIETPDGPSVFLTTTFLKAEPSGSHVERGYWSFCGNGRWVCPEHEKLEFAGEQWALYKLYVFSSAGMGKAGPQGEDYCDSFIKEFVPALNTALRPVLVSTGRIKEVLPVNPTPAAPALEPAPVSLLVPSGPDRR